MRFFEKYRDDEQAMMLFMERLKMEDQVDVNDARLTHLAKHDNSYVRFPRQDVLSGTLNQLSTSSPTFSSRHGPSNTQDSRRFLNNPSQDDLIGLSTDDIAISSTNNQNHHHQSQTHLFGGNSVSFSHFNSIDHSVGGGDACSGKAMMIGYKTKNSSISSRRLKQNDYYYKYIRCPKSTKRYAENRNGTVENVRFKNFIPYNQNEKPSVEERREEYM